MTIKDIAKACNVSVSTVSRVLNQRPDVSEAVRCQVLAAMDAMGYIPNNSARDLVRSSSDSIGVVVRGTGNPFFAEMLKTISCEIDRAGYTMVLHFIDSSEDEVKAGAILEREKKLVGLLFLGGRFDYTSSELSLVGVPFVCCSFTNCFGSLENDAYSSVSIDDYATAYRAVRHLIDLGHRDIAVLVPSCNDHSISELRYAGYRAALKDNGLTLDSAMVAEAGSFNMDSSYRATRALIESGVSFSALFTVSDTSAIAAIKALRDYGLAVPGDCSVIAIDGLEVTDYICPTLSTMVQPVEELGRDSVSSLIDMICGRKPRHIRLEAKLREGATVSRK